MRSKTKNQLKNETDEVKNETDKKSRSSFPGDRLFFSYFCQIRSFFPDQTGVRDRSDFRLMMLYVLSGRNSAGSEADNAG